jgi:hypothetical protein
MTTHQSQEELREGKILRYCSRCGAEWCILGKVLKWGKHYPAYTVKKADGTKEERPADTEIKEALCRQCAKEHYDNEKIRELSLTTEKIRGEVLGEFESLREWVAYRVDKGKGMSPDETRECMDAFDEILQALSNPPIE